MKIIFLISGGRNGSLFFQSVLDGHPDILQLPGIFYLDEFLVAINKTMGVSKAGEIFVEMYPEFFDSRLNKIHRMGQLGEDKSAYFVVDKKAFLDQLSELLPDVDPSNYVSLIVAIHKAYCNSSRKKSETGRKNVLLIHLHHAHRLKRVAEFVSVDKCSSLFMERDPVASFVSEIKGWTSYLGNNRLDLYTKSLERKLFEPYNTLTICADTVTVRLEDLHIKTDLLMRSFCSRYSIKYDDCLTKSTFNGLLWWGDAVSARLLNGFNNNFVNKYDEGFFYEWEHDLLSSVLSERSVKYGYAVSRKNTTSKWLLFLPGKYEIESIGSEIKLLVFGELKEKIRASKRLVLFYRVLIKKYNIINSIDNVSIVPDSLVP